MDIAGLHDTGGKFFEFINMLIVKKIFSIAEKVRILIPITDKQIEDSKGLGLVQQVKILLEVFKGSQLQDIQDSILPVLTKVDPRNLNFDLEESMSKSLKILETYLANYSFEELGLKSCVIDAFISVNQLAAQAGWSQAKRYDAMIEKAHMLLL